MKSRDLKLFSLLIFLSFGMMVMGEKPKVLFGKALGRVVFFPFQKGVSFTRGLLEIKKKSRTLSTRLASLSLENQLLQEFRYENENLRRLVEFKEKGEFEMAPAEVIGRSPGRMNQSLLIDRGKKNGIRINMPVVTYEGIVGKVIELTDHTALVQTLFDRNSRVSSFVQRSRALGILRWRSGTTLLLDNVPIQEDVQIGDRIISSGFGGIFPKGLQAGTIRETREGRRGLFHKIIVEPAVSSKVEEVFIITGESKIAPALGPLDEGKGVSEKEIRRSPILPPTSLHPAPLQKVEIETRPSGEELTPRSEGRIGQESTSPLPKVKKDTDTLEIYFLPEPKIRTEPLKPERN
ncbi:rod shape-determining protein MreC [candidate division TA06 bacterium]|nr:rod shape-determining protein MreC [candidate division TA06 bacterium]